MKMRRYNRRFNEGFVPKGTCCVVAAVVAGVATVAGSAIAGGEAANATESAANTAASTQRAALAQQASLAAPYTQLGQSALPQYQALLGLGPQGAAGEQSTLAQTPGYQFSLGQGLQATQNQASATGLGLSGNNLEALDKFSTGLADNTYQNQVGNLQSAVQIGQGAAAGQAANVGNVATNLSNIATNQGTNLANIDIAETAGITNSINNAANQYTTQNTLKALQGLGGGTGPALAGDQSAFQAGAPGLVSAGDGYLINQ